MKKRSLTEDRCQESKKKMEINKKAKIEGKEDEDEGEDEERDEERDEEGDEEEEEEDEGRKVC